MNAPRSLIRVSILSITVGFVVAVNAVAWENADSDWRSSFSVDKANLVPTGKNPFFILEPGHVSHFQGDQETLTITVLDDTKLVDGVHTRVVEERETKNGKLVEVSRNYFAIDKMTNDVFYFGEAVDIYVNGKVANHEGSWLSGVEGAKFGLMMPGTPKVGDKFYQEVAPKVAMDRCQIIALDSECKTPAGSFTSCLRVEDSSPLEKAVSHKVFAPGVGLIRDDDFVLTKTEESSAEKKDQDDKEIKLALSDCPGAVQATLKREANGAKIDSVDRESDDGKTIYEVDVKLDGKNYEIKVAADGTLISKALDEEEDAE